MLAITDIDYHSTAIGLTFCIHALTKISNTEDLPFGILVPPVKLCALILSPLQRAIPASILDWVRGVDFDIARLCARAFIHMGYFITHLLDRFGLHGLQAVIVGSSLVRKVDDLFQPLLEFLKYGVLLIFRQR